MSNLRPQPSPIFVLHEGDYVDDLRHNNPVR